MTAPSQPEPDDLDGEDRDPRDVDLERRAGSPAISLWLIMGLIAMIGALVYAVSALI